MLRRGNKIKCSCCDRFLSDYESTLRHAITREFLDTCNKCLEDLNIPVVGRPDLEKTTCIEDEDTYGLEDEEDNI